MYLKQLPIRANDGGLACSEAKTLAFVINFKVLLPALSCSF